MTAELLEQDATDAERLIIAWLGPLEYRLATERKSGDPLPMVIVNEITATEDSQQISAYPVVSLHILAATVAEVKTAASRVHRRMLLLARDPLQDIVLSDDSTMSIEWLETLERPHAEYYSDTVKQRIGRYEMGVPFTDTEGE